MKVGDRVWVQRKDTHFMLEPGAYTLTYIDGLMFRVQDHGGFDLAAYTITPLPDLSPSDLNVIREALREHVPIAKHAELYAKLGVEFSNVFTVGYYSWAVRGGCLFSENGVKNTFLNALCYYHATCMSTKSFIAVVREFFDKYEAAMEEAQ